MRARTWSVGSACGLDGREECSMIEMSYPREVLGRRMVAAFAAGG